MTAIGRHAANQQAARNRERLFEAAAALFVEQGYADTTMADIAVRAGTSRRTAFNHFPNKGDIPMLWTRRMADRAMVVVDSSADDQALERIRAYFRTVSRMVEAEPELAGQMMLGWTASVGPIRYESQFLSDLAPLLTAGQQQGLIDRSVEVAVAARTLSDIYMGMIFRWVRDQGAARPTQKIADGGIELVLSAIRARDDAETTSE